MAETRFFDFTGLTGVSFLEHLNNELKFEKPDAVIINPFNAFFGGDLNSGKDVSAIRGSRARTAACAAFPMLLSGISILR